MPLKAGGSALGGDLNEERPATDGIEPGDAVGANAAGEQVAADSNSSVEAIGVHMRGDRGDTMGLAGAYVTNVEDDISDGDRLDTPDDSLSAEDAGALTQSGTGRFRALCDEGGTWQDQSVPDGYAVVLW